MPARAARTESGPPDPFAAVLQSLKESARDVDALLDPLQTVEDVVSTVDLALVNVSKIPSILQTIDGVMVGIGGILKVLAAVPIVDVVATACQGVMTTAQSLLKQAKIMADEINRALIKPCRTIFEDLEKGIGKALTVVTTISQTIPNYINTIQILIYMEAVARPLVKVLKGTESEESLNKLLDEFDAVKKAATRALDPVAEFLHDLDSAMQAIIHALGDEYEKIKSTAESVAADLDWVESKFRPLENGFNKVLHAIAPVKWALDAIQWVFDHVFQPVVREILKKTHLDSQVGRVRETIEEKLGIKSIVNLLTQNVDASTSVLWQQAAGSQSAQSGAFNWAALVDILKAYDTRDSESTKRSILMLVNAIAGTAIDPEKPARVPDWPRVPDFQEVASQPAAGLLRAALARNRRAARIDRAFAALQGMGRPANDGVPSAAPRFMAMSLPQIADARLPAGLDNVARLQQQGVAAVQALKDMDQVAETLVAGLGQFDAARQLPGDFHTQMQDFADLFENAEKLLSFLEGFGVLASILKQLDEPLKRHGEQASSIEASVKRLVDASQQVDATIQAVEKAVPGVETFTDAFQFIDAAATGSASLARLIDQAEVLDAQLDGKFSGRIADLAGRVNTAAGAVLEQLDQVTNAARAALDDARAINAYLAQYGSHFVQLGADSKIVGDTALPKLTNGVHYFGVFVSILDPLSCLLQQLECVSGSNPLKAGAAGAVELIRQAADAGIQSQSRWVGEAFDFVIDQTVPMKVINADVDAINTFVADRRTSFAASVSAMEKHLGQLASAMQARASYVLDGTKIENVLVDQDFADTAAQLYREISEACQQAGITASNLRP